MEVYEYLKVAKEGEIATDQEPKNANNQEDLDQATAIRQKQLVQ